MSKSSYPAQPSVGYHVYGSTFYNRFIGRWRQSDQQLSKKVRSLSKRLDKDKLPCPNASIKRHSWRSWLCLNEGALRQYLIVEGFKSSHLHQRVTLPLRVMFGEYLFLYGSAQKKKKLQHPRCLSPYSITLRGSSCGVCSRNQAKELSHPFAQFKKRTDKYHTPHAKNKRSTCLFQTSRRFS